MHDYEPKMTANYKETRFVLRKGLTFHMIK